MSGLKPKEQQVVLELEDLKPQQDIFMSNSSAETSLCESGASEPSVLKRCFSWAKSKLKALKKHPFLVALVLVGMCAVIGLGVWGVIAGANKSAASKQQDALQLASEKVSNIESIMMSAFNAAITLASIIRSNPYNLTCLEEVFVSIAPDLYKMPGASSVFNMQIVPNGVIRRIIPIHGFERAVGLDLFRLPTRRPYCMKAAETMQAVTSGPELLSFGNLWCFVVLCPVFVPDVDMYETFNLPDVHGVPNALNPNGVPTNMYSTTYRRDDGHGIYANASGNCPDTVCYRNDTHSKFWGFGKTVVNWENLKKDTKLYDLCKTHDFLITHVELDGSTRVIASCSDTRMQPTQWPGVWNGTVGPYTLKDYLPRKPVSVEIKALQNSWMLYMVPANKGMVGSSSGGDSWRPSWEGPLIAMVVIVSVLLALLLLMLIASAGQREELLEAQERLLEAEMAARGALEEEKKHTDALIVRQLNLIACFASGGSITGDAMSDARTHSSMEIATVNRIEAVRRHLNSGQSADDQIEVTTLLGEGGFGKVYKGTWRGGEVAVKTIVLPANMSGAAKREKMAIMEAAISTSMLHPNVVQTYTYAIRPIRDADQPGCAPTAPVNEDKNTGLVLNSLSKTEFGPPSIVSSAKDRNSSEQGIISYEVRLVLEYCDRGTLRDALDRNLFFSTSPFNYKAVLDTACDVARAMLHLHSGNVLHSDLKARNVMLRSSGSDSRRIVAKVADFGLSISLDDQQTHMSALYQGTLTHMAPEVLMRGHVSKAADVYAFGITMYELVTGCHPFSDTPKAHLGHAITVGKLRPSFGMATPRAFRELAEQCWHEDPEARPTFAEVLDRLIKMRQAQEGPTPALNLSVLDTPPATEREQVSSTPLAAAPLLPMPALTLQGVPVAKKRPGPSRARSSCGNSAIVIDSELGSVPEGKESFEEERGSGEPTNSSSGCSSENTMRTSSDPAMAKGSS